MYFILALELSYLDIQCRCFVVTVIKVFNFNPALTVLSGKKCALGKLYISEVLFEICVAIWKQKHFYKGFVATCVTCIASTSSVKISGRIWTYSSLICLGG